MQTQEWSRSRYWLCHFLHNRHERMPVDWSAGVDIEPALAHALARWAVGSWAFDASQSAWIVLTADATFTASDPQYVQCVRLLGREQQQHARLLAMLAARFGQAPDARRAPTRSAAMLAARRLGGLRFELSVQMLSDTVHTNLLALLSERLRDPALRGVCAWLHRDRRAHVTFHAERLTMEFADFNFVRRNLRRARLRGMFALMLGAMTVEHAGLLRLAGIHRGQFVAACWADFADTLERVVPYYRDALLAQMTQQSRDRYASHL